MPADPFSAKALLTISGFTFGRATTWVTKLAKAWKRIRAERRKELAIAAEDFGNLEALAEVYIEPDCQPQNPADDAGDDPVYDFRKPIGSALGKFLKSTPVEHDGSHVMFILSDAGMGKSSLLMMLKLSHDVKKFWPSDVRFELVKIGADTTDHLEAMPNKPHTVLLLDALDEDPTAWGRIEERLKELLQASKAFRQVILTCRTQFFPKKVEDPRFGRVVIEGFRCNLLYLSPFSDNQIWAYLKRGIDWAWWERLVHLVGRDSARKARAFRITSTMSSLRTRPMLLREIDDLMAAKVERWDAYSVYDVLVDSWLDREKRKGLTAHTKEDLRKACKQLAVLLHGEGRRRLPEAELDAKELGELRAAPIRSIDVKGRSLLNRTSEGDYRFAHLSIQEFFVAESFVLGVTNAPLPVTDQILEFLKGWIVAEPLRVQEFRWDLLDYSKAEDLPDLTGLVNAELNTDRANRLLKGTGAKLMGAKLTGAYLIGANLPGADLRSADLSGANLTRADLTNANLRRADLRSADLAHANLRGDLRGAYLREARLREAKLNGADLLEANLRRADLSRAYLRNANLTRAYLRNADLTGADLTGANLTRADLTGANLIGVTLTSANLAHADLINADLSLADLRQALNLTQAQINFARGNQGGTRLPAGLTRPDHWETE